MSEHLGGCIISGDIGTWSPQVWNHLIKTLNVKSYLDVGCGAGHSLKFFIDNGIDGSGVEGYLPAIESSQVKDQIVIHDYTNGPYIPDKFYDLAWCCEFVEHVEQEYVKNFMVTFQSCQYVAMTHGLPDQPGHHHVNCQPPEYWISTFKDFGFEYQEEESLFLRSLLPSYTFANNQFLNDKNEAGKFENGIDPNLPNGGHVKSTLKLFKNTL